VQPKEYLEIHRGKDAELLCPAPGIAGGEREAQKGSD
jgi:hypothetical protein